MMKGLNFKNTWILFLRKNDHIHNKIVRHRRDTENYLVKEDEEVVLKGCKVLPKRWVVERTFALIGRCRRLSKDYGFYEKKQNNRFGSETNNLSGEDVWLVNCKVPSHIK